MSILLVEKLNMTAFDSGAAAIYSVAEHLSFELIFSMKNSLFQTNCFFLPPL